MDRLDLAAINDRSADKSGDAPFTPVLSADVYVLLLDLLSLLSDNQWFFEVASEAARDLTDKAYDEVLQ